jgi:hypothetical protein
MNEGKWAKRDAIKRINAETSVGQRMTEARTVAPSEDGKPRNAFGDRADGKAVATPVVPIVNPARTKGGVVEGSELTAARQAYMDGRKQAADAKVLGTQVQALATDPETAQAIFKGWMSATPSFHPSDFNLESMSNALTEMTLRTGRPLSVGLLNEVLAHLKNNNFLESARPLRGEAAAELYPQYVEPQTNVHVPARQLNSTVIDPAEREALRNVPLDELAKRVRAGYKR